MMMVTEENKGILIETFKKLGYKNPEKNVQAAVVGCKKESDLTDADRKYYGAPEYRGYEGANSDGSPAFNVNGAAIEFDFELKNREKCSSSYRRFCQDMFYRRFMGYDLPYFKVPTDKSLIAIHDECAKEAGMPELCIQKPNAIELPDFKMSAAAAYQQAKAEAEHPVDDAESEKLVSDFLSYVIDRSAPEIADGNNELMNCPEFKGMIEGVKEAVISFVTDGEIDLDPLAKSAVSLLDKIDTDGAKNAKALIESINLNELLQKSALSGIIADASDKIKRSVITLVKTANEKPFISACAEVVAEIGKFIGKDIDSKELARTLQKSDGDDIRHFAAMFRKDRKDDIAAATTVVAEVVDNDGNTLSTSNASIVDNSKTANNDNAVKTASEKREERRARKAAESAESNDDANEPETFVEVASNGVKLVVDEDRYNGFEKNHQEFLKHYPGLQEFLDLLRDDQKCKFLEFGGLVRAELFDVGSEIARYLYIDPAKIHPGYGVIIPRGLNNESLDPLTDIRCEFKNAKMLVQFNQYNQADYNRDNAATMPNLSFYEHVQYNRIPENDLPYVIGILKWFTDTLSSMGMCLRFKPINYKSKDVFTLACNTKVGLHDFAKHNHLYNGLEIDIHCMDGRYVRYNAHGKGAEDFASRVNAFTGSNMIGLGIEARELNEEADKKVAEKLKSVAGKVVKQKGKKNKTA